MNSTQLKEIIAEEVFLVENNIQPYDSWEDCYAAESIWETVKSFKKEKKSPKDVFLFFRNTLYREDDETSADFPTYGKRTHDYAIGLALLAAEPKFVDDLKDTGADVGQIYRLVAYSLRNLYTSHQLDEYQPRLVFKLMKNVQGVLNIK